MESRLELTLDSADPAVRFNAALVLAERNDPVALPVLLEALAHGSETTRRHHAIPAILRLKDAAAGALWEAVGAGDLRAVGAAHALWRIDATCLSRLVPLLRVDVARGGGATCGEAAWLLGQIGPPAAAATAELVRLLADERVETSLRIQAARSLAAIGEPVDQVVPALRGAVASRAAPSRWWSGGVPLGCRVVEALGQIGERAASAVPELVDLLGDAGQPFDTRVQAAYSLAAIGVGAGVRDRTQAALVRAVRDDDWWLRAFAVRALMFFAEATGRSDAAVPALVRALADEEWQVRRNAIFALARLGAAAQTAQTAQAAIPPLCELLADAGDASYLAVEALAKCGAGGMAALCGVLRRPDERARRLAAYALKRASAAGAVEAERALAESGVKPLTPRPPDCDLELPELPLTAEKVAAFEALIEQAVSGDGTVTEYRLPYPKYEFVCYLADEKGMMIHGSNRIGIDVLSPVRQSTDANAWGNVHGIYADPDGIRPIYFATVDRTKVGGLSNGMRREVDGGRVRRFYHFSMDAEALRNSPLTDGMVYALPKERFGKGEHEWTCREPLRPLVRVGVSPADFPFADSMAGFERRAIGSVDPMRSFFFLRDVHWYVIKPPGAR